MAHLDYLTFHELRHTSATYLINKGVNPKAVSQRLGHSDTSVTMEIYSHTFEHSLGTPFCLRGRTRHSKRRCLS